MGSSEDDLHILFFPFMAQGHLLPTIDMVKLFAGRGVRATVLTTPANAPLIKPSIDRANDGFGNQNPIQLSLIPFPSGTGLPEGCENASSVPGPLKSNFFSAMGLLREPFRQVLEDIRPDCVVTGLFFPWTLDVAAELGIPRLGFYGSNFFSRCAAIAMHRHKVLDNLPTETSSLVIPDLPHRIEMLRTQIMDIKKSAPFLQDMMNQILESEEKSHGLIVNSFYEVEPDYADHYRNVIGGKAWHIGPMSLCNQDIVDKSTRGSLATIDGDECLNWLDGKSPGTVVYVCFGSTTEFTTSQLHELALGLEACRHPFVWVVGKGGDESLPDGFEERVRGRGLVIKGWAPQILILNHATVGGFVTHCGWNSSLEGITAGLPFVTWPIFADQFYNEKLIVDLLKTGVSSGVKEYAWRPDERVLVKAATIEKAVNELMGEGEEAEERRRRAKELGDSAKRAVGVGGSSYVDMSNLIQELKDMRNVKGLEKGIEEIVV